MIDPRARILLFFLGLAVLVLAVNLVRKRQLQERYALLWLLAGLVLVLAPLFVNVIDRLAAAARFWLSARPSADAGGHRADADHRPAFAVDVQPGRSDQDLDPGTRPAAYGAGGDEGRSGSNLASVSC